MTTERNNRIPSKLCMMRENDLCFPVWGKARIVTNYCQFSKSANSRFPTYYKIRKNIMRFVDDFETSFTKIAEIDGFFHRLLSQTTQKNRAAGISCIKSTELTFQAEASLSSVIHIWSTPRLSSGDICSERVTRFRYAMLALMRLDGTKPLVRMCK